MKNFVLTFGSDCDGAERPSITQYKNEKLALKSANHSNEWSDGVLHSVATFEMAAAYARENDLKMPEYYFDEDQELIEGNPVKEFSKYYRSLDLNKRINLKGKGAMLNPWFIYVVCPFIGNIKSLQMLDINFASVLLSDTVTWTNAGTRVFFGIDGNSPIRRQFEDLGNLKYHYRRAHSMYPADSYDYLNLGQCNR